MSTVIDKEWMQSLLSSFHNGLIVIDPHNRIVLLNDAAKQLLRIEGEEWKGKDIHVLLPETKLPHVAKTGERMIGAEAIIHGRTFLVNHTPFYENGELAGAIAILQDFTEIEHYRQLSKRMETIIEFSTDGIYVVDGNGITLMVNSAYEQITGFRREELIGRHMEELVREGYFDQSVSLLVLKQKQRISMLQTVGGKKDVIVTGNPVFNEQGDIEMVVTSVRDISELNKLKLELEKAKSFSQLNQHRYTFSVDNREEAMICRSPAMKTLIDKVMQIAAYPTTVLLTGPSGVGKEVIANLIHYLSPRKDAPFIKVNCAAIPEALLESELFGYEKGAFTGAQAGGKIGLFELADGGTILLDEIGEMPLSLQVKLLRVLQEKRIQRIGGRKAKALDVRVIAATNQDLQKQMEAGLFRTDLYYRLHVVELYVPPLSERPQDIEPLLDHYFSFFCEQYRIPKKLSPAAKAILERYHWPGNVRELKNLMENLVVSVPSRCIEPDDLPSHVRRQTESPSASTLKEKVEQYEKRLVFETLEAAPSLRKAAEQLGIDHSTLVKKLQRWGIAKRPRP
ncbi:Fis family transcriptional regulator [Geobacillus thermopakistaniensis]|uniref:HTH-type transcriptional regulatory protein TyrR n=2 Tax=Geobacillus thermopakistaniensis (strain MAS1) TaxID=1408282 RepID=A0A7U9J9S9_GEOTM|nr:sigma 54-interacting transcriptional regulator [Geobacillus sp. MAS1]ESU71589.1 Fis family transcriptional regulator [Geobacillus sp. MAS1]